MTFRDLTWPHVTWYCQFILFEVNKIREKVYEKAYVIRKNGIKIKDLMIWWMVSVKKERNHSEKEKDFGQ